MKKLTERIQQLFAECIETKIAAADSLAGVITEAGERMVQSLLGEKKILSCGNGGAASCAQIFTAHMLNHFETERPGLPAIALTADSATVTAISNDYSYDQVFAKQISALGQPGDVLLVITTSGHASSIIKACEAAHERDIDVIALTGGDGGVLANHMGPEDIEIRVPSESPSRILEVHLLVLHILSDLIDNCLFGHYSE